ncbi:MAG TPA: D-alanine--(R)-lactate ligase [Solirubrobacteraceae bacterium]|nr:D-alanine--(R)-lactate ligase [Solirubrobacteraceae bacterium]
MSRDTRLRVGIIFGGSSEEHPVSVKSAREIAAHLDRTRYEPFWIGITTHGAWRLCDGPDVGWEHSNARRALLSPDRANPGLLILDGERHQTISLDLVLPVLHGRLGEDGAIQGLLELSGMPYAGCDIQSSAICMDKSLAYTVAASAGISTPSFVVLAPGEDIDGDALSYPVFVKPARSGSSFGVTKVTSRDEIHGAIRAARRYDAKVLIESAVAGDEVGCAIYGNEGDLQVGEVDQIALSDGFFRIHQELEPERGSDNATVLVPARIPADARALVQETAKAIYRALGCRGLSRVDMFLTEDGRVVLNEVNTLPGMTSYSRYPRMMAAAGLPFAQMIDRVLALALEAKSR